MQEYERESASSLHPGLCRKLEAVERGNFGKLSNQNPQRSLAPSMQQINAAHSAAYDRSMDQNSPDAYRTAIPWPDFKSDKTVHTGNFSMKIPFKEPFRARVYVTVRSLNDEYTGVHLFFGVSHEGVVCYYRGWTPCDPARSRLINAMGVPDPLRLRWGRATEYPVLMRLVGYRRAG